ncbi:rRNA biogenesis protein rrp5 [Ceratocystis pirilliformis]|uniref:rRNA biogenesis protein rrp5 n=1 Tax=Ceratocystis pirilliformis TaxID=259994 RepID=A0ABR3YW08_9PEZI
MSALKRKEAPGVGANPPSKSAKTSKSPQTKKRVNVTTASAVASTAAGKKTTNAFKNKANEVVSAPTKSILASLREEEPLFPRGGGSVLTPLEQKRIGLEAKADALAEDELLENSSTKAIALKKDRGPKRAKADGKLLKDPNAVKIEALNFKKVVKGSLILAQITEVKPLSLTLDLPNNLTGTVSITYVSDTLTQRLQAAANAEENNDDDDGDDDNDDDNGDSDGSSANVDLQQLFTVGQYVRAAVLSTNDGAGKSRRHIDLSLRPSDCNAGLAHDDLVPNSMVMASVVSLEEKGCIMDLGISNHDVRGFLPRKELDKSIPEERLQPGAVLFCQVTGKTGKVAQLTTQAAKISSVKNTPHEATTINTFVPGTVVDLLIVGTTWGGLYGKIMGSLDATADLIQSGVGPLSVNLESKHKVGSKIKARVIYSFPSTTAQKVGVSLLPHILSLECKKIGGSMPTKSLPISTFVNEAVVKHVETEMGLFMDIGQTGFRGFAHISAVSDEKVDALFESSGPYQIDSKHKARITSYNAMDGMFQLSLQPAVLARQYLRMEDVPIGAIVDCTVENVPVGPDGVTGVVAKISPGIVGFIIAKHLADVELQNPEKKFRPGVSIKARVLALDLQSRKLRLTLKKTLVNSDAPVISTFDQAVVGLRIPGTISKLMPHGAFIHFYGNLRGFLPVSQMSEALIKDPSEHFRVGQVVSVHILDADPEKRRLVVSCRDPSAFGIDKQNALKNLKIGDSVSGKVMEKAEDMVVLELGDSGLKAFLPLGHLSDKSGSKNRAILKKLHVGQSISDLTVLEKHEHRHAITLTQKPSLVKAAKEGNLVQDTTQIKVGSTLAGFVGHITSTAVFVRFAAKASALLPKSRMLAEIREEPNFGFELLQSVSVEVVTANAEQGRPVVVIAGTKTEQKPKADSMAMPTFEGITGDFGFGTLLKAKITAVKTTQVNIQVLECSELQGRVDVSQLYDSLSDIANVKTPLAHLSKGDVIPVRVLGVHDARNHSYLPISHRYKAHQVLELTARPSDLAAEKPQPLSFEQIKRGSKHLAFVNNSDKHGVWVSLAPNVGGRIAAVDLSDDMTLLSNIRLNFPVGMALMVNVTSVNVERKLLGLSVRSEAERKKITWDSLQIGTVLPSRVTKVSDRQVLVKLSEEVSGPIHLPDLHDDFDQARPQNFKKNDLMRISVVDVDVSNKRVRFSARASRVISSSSAVTDREIIAFDQLTVGDIVRGFVKSIADGGLFVLLGGNVTARVKISNLSDKYVKDWKAAYQIDQLVRGRVVSVDSESQRVELSLKETVLSPNYVPAKSWHDLKKGMVLAGHVRKVEDYGAFVEVENSDHVRGLCHRSEMAEQAVADARKLYNEGDRVKVKILSINMDKKRVNFGMKASYFECDDSDNEDIEMGGVSLETDGQDVEDASEIEGDEEENNDDEEDEDENDSEDENITVPQSSSKHYDWAADPFAQSDSDSDSDVGAAAKKASKKKKAIQTDKTASLDVNGPKSAADYEKLLLENPDDADLWLEYMALPLQLGDVTKARDVAERAIKTVNVREEMAKMNIWLGYINLEAEFGTKDRLEAVFQRACQYNDEQEIHARVASVYIQTQRYEQAEAIFEAMAKKFGAVSADVWTNYAHFLHATLGRPDKARALLSRALQALKDTRVHLPLTVKFAALEFRSAHGDVERGRTFFAGILDSYPKKGDLWSQLLDLELAHAVAAIDKGEKADVQAIRDLFERRTKAKGLKPVPAQKWFERWADWETRSDAKGREKVMAKAKAWVLAYKAKQASKSKGAEEDVEME